MIQAIWFEDLFNASDSEYITRMVNLFFIDVDDDIEKIGNEIIDGRIPYDVIPEHEAGVIGEIISSHMVRPSEFESRLGSIASKSIFTLL